MRDATLTALRFAALPHQLTFDPAARERWIDVYGPLSRGEPGLLGAATHRAEAHVVRLAAIYATLDTSDQIRLPHLEAALAVWRYSADSARWIFGDSLGDPTADDIWALAKTRPAGVTRTEVRDLFSRNKKAREIDRALTVLEEAGRLQRTTISDGRGPPRGDLAARTRTTRRMTDAFAPAVSTASRRCSETSFLSYLLTASQPTRPSPSSPTCQRRKSPATSGTNSTRVDLACVMTNSLQISTFSQPSASAKRG
ncbi:MAG: hypothetical protein ACR2H2_12120 [Solirubrobacteraceae bacterium]